MKNELLEDVIRIIIIFFVAVVVSVVLLYLGQALIGKTRTEVVLDLKEQGIIEPELILNYLNYNEAGEEIGDFTLEEVKNILSNN